MNTQKNDQKKEGLDVKLTKVNYFKTINQKNQEDSSDDEQYVKVDDPVHKKIFLQQKALLLQKKLLQHQKKQQTSSKIPEQKKVSQNPKLIQVEKSKIKFVQKNTKDNIKNKESQIPNEHKITEDKIKNHETDNRQKNKNKTQNSQANNYQAKNKETKNNQKTIQTSNDQAKNTETKHSEIQNIQTKNNIFSQKQKDKQSKYKEKVTEGKNQKSLNRYKEIVLNKSKEENYHIRTIYPDLKLKQNQIQIRQESQYENYFKKMCELISENEYISIIAFDSHISTAIKLSENANRILQGLQRVNLPDKIQIQYQYTPKISSQSEIIFQKQTKPMITIQLSIKNSLNPKQFGYQDNFQYKDYDRKNKHLKKIYPKQKSKYILKEQSDIYN